MRNIIGISIIFVAFIASGCVSNKTVRPEDLAAWKGVPVIALDTHSIFSTMPMVRTKIKGGIEMRNYINSKQYSQCTQSGYGNSYGNVSGNGSGNIYGNIHSYSGQASLSSNSYYNSVTNCTKGIVGCNNIFYIKNGRVLDYAPSGQCYTDARAQPEPRYKQFIK